MVSTRRSGGVVEDINGLSLRSRTIDVESRHQNSANAPHEKGGSGTPRKRRKIAAKLDEDADDAKTNSPGDDRLVAVMRPEANAGEEPANSPTAAAASPELGSVEGDVEGTGPSKQLDAAMFPAAEPIPAEIVDEAHRIHKRFRSGEPESDMGNELGSTAVATESTLADAQASVPDSSAGASDDEDAPEMFSTNVKQTLPFTPATKEPKLKKRKPAKSALKDVDYEESPSASTSQPEKLSGDGDDPMPLPVSDVLPPPKKLTKGAATPSLKRKKDIMKDGVIYRTVSSEGMRGQTSPWLPAKASQESRRIKDRLLVRKRVQEVNHGRCVKFVTSR
jgi:hypothetical protein